MSETGYWTRRASRRGALGTGTLSLGAALLACSGSSKPKSGSSPPSSAAAPGTGQSISTPTRLVTPSATVDPSKINKSGILHSRQANPYASINPYKGLDSGGLFGYTVFDHLWFVPSDTGKMVLFLADSLEPQDATHFTVKLKQAFFHNKPPINGRQVKAQDVAASFMAAKLSKTVQASQWWRLVLDKAVAVDDLTVNVSQSSVDAWSFSSTNAGSPITSIILPQEAAANPDSMDNDMVGSGRFQFVSHENGTNFKLKRFDNWRIKGEPYLAGIEYRLLQQQAGANAAFAAGQIDGIGFQNKLERDQTAAALGSKITTYTEPTASNWMIVHKGDKQFADPRVRQAISYALDRDDFIQLMYFGDATKTSHVPLIFQKHALDPKELADTMWKFDATAAKQLIAASGFDLSKEYQLKYNAANDNQNQMAQITQAHLQKNLGMKIKLVSQDLATWLNQTVPQGDYDFITYPTLQYADPSSYLLGVAKSNGKNPNGTGFLDDELDDLLAKQKLILDDDQRAEAVKGLQRKMIEKWAPYVPVISPLSSTAIWNWYHIADLGKGGLANFSGQTYVDQH